MPEEIEQIMREIHILFAKAEKLPENQNKIIVDKQIMFQLLERLSHEVYETMDRFEETKVSRQRAKKKREEEEKEALERVSKSAEEIYAASILYSDDTLDELKKTVEDAEEKLKHTYKQMERQMKGYLSYIEENKRELHEQLDQMAQRRLYLQILEEKENLKSKEELPKEENMGIFPSEDRADSEEEPIEQAEELSLNKEEEQIYLDDEPKKVEIVVKTADNIEQKLEEVKQARSANLYDMQEVKAKRKNNISSDLKKEEEAEMMEQEAAIGQEISHFRAEDFDLDAEYFAWAEGKDAQGGSLEVNNKKGLRDFFKRNK